MLVCDGGVTNNTPVFADGIRRQLVFRLYEVEYPYRMLINPVDTCIDLLVLRGAILMARFLQGEVTDSINWLERKEAKRDLYIKPNYYFRLAVIPFAVGGIIVAHATGLASAVMPSSATGQLIAFDDGAKMFSTGPLRYVSGLLFATLVDVLRKNNLLL